MWKYLSDIKSYPNYVTFVKKVEVEGKIKKGTEWYDTTGILWIPVRLYHINTHWEEQNKIAFWVKMPPNGEMCHEYSLIFLGDKTKLTCIVSFDFHNKLIDAILGKILSRRLGYMLSSSVERLEKKLMVQYHK